MTIYIFPKDGIQQLNHFHSWTIANTLTISINTNVSGGWALSFLVPSGTGLHFQATATCLPYPCAIHHAQSSNSTLKTVGTWILACAVNWSVDTGDPSAPCTVDRNTWVSLFHRDRSNNHSPGWTPASLISLGKRHPSVQNSLHTSP